MASKYTVNQKPGGVWRVLKDGKCLGLAFETEREAELVATRYTHMDNDLLPGWRKVAKRMEG